MTHFAPSAAPRRRRPLPFLRRLRYLVEAAGLFLAIGFFRLFDVDRASNLGGWIGRKLVAPSRRSNLARNNLVAAYPEKSAPEIEHIVRGMWDNLGRVLAEYAHLDKIRATGPNPRIAITGTENLPSPERRANGMLVVSAHLANWEVIPIAAHNAGLTGASVVRPPNNPYVDHWLERTRKLNGIPETVAKGSGGMRRILSLLRQGKSIALLIDQRASEGIPVPFFGHDALTNSAPATLALRLGAVVAPLSIERVGPARFHVHFHPPIERARSGDWNQDVVGLTTALNAFVEARVRAHPEQWLWIHRRWVEPDAPLRKRAQALSSNGGANNATSNRV